MNVFVSFLMDDDADLGLRLVLAASMLSLPPGS